MEAHALSRGDLIYQDFIYSIKKAAVVAPIAALVFTKVAPSTPIPITLGFVTTAIAISLLINTSFNMFLPADVLRDQAISQLSPIVNAISIYFTAEVFSRAGYRL